ncbi:hypothetical protein [Flavihumibacter sp. CACIAM 22H1]|uniref:hypothetical protein n=1 Tax=Flavihumibacter sp. CACIAM 22H1 TaxID=1812911 RepID=UPI0025C64A06|nr:hypothetical protein [Flavihumibacter sp. CACIAM 22H1]
MKTASISFIALVAVLFLSACADNSSFSPAEDAQDAGREFIRASLDGNMTKAEFYLLKDSANTMLFEKWKKDYYNKLSTEERVSFKNANILPIKIENENDSTVHYSFSNSYKSADTTTVKIVRSNGIWQVDLKELH